MACFNTSDEKIMFCFDFSDIIDDIAFTNLQITNVSDPTVETSN